MPEGPNASSRNSTGRSPGGSRGSSTPGSLTRTRAFVSPQAGEDWSALAARVLPDAATAEAVQKLKSWNLHLFARLPPGEFTGSDVLFVEPPQEPGGPALPSFENEGRDG